MSKNDDVNERLTNAMHGTPQTLPDQRRHYLGSLRERVVLAIKIKELQDERTLRLFKQHLQDYDGKTALVNGKVTRQLISPYMQTLAQANFPFTLVNKPETPYDAEAIALLIVADKAVDQKEIDILKQFAQPATKPYTPPKKEKGKKGLLHDLFD